MNEPNVSWKSCVTSACLSENVTCTVKIVANLIYIYYQLHGLSPLVKTHSSVSEASYYEIIAILPAFVQENSRLHVVCRL